MGNLSDSVTLCLHVPHAFIIVLAWHLMIVAVLLLLPLSPGPSIDLHVTSAAGSRDAFHTATTTLPLEAVSKCPGSTCKGAPAATAAAPAATAAATTALAAPTAAAMQRNQTATAAATPKNAQSAAGSGCGQSQFGYACKAALQSGAALHFTRGGQVPPANPCTSTTQQTTPLTGTGSNGEPVHFLLESPLSGYAGE